MFNWSGPSILRSFLFLKIAEPTVTKSTGDRTTNNSMAQTTLWPINHPSCTSHKLCYPYTEISLSWYSVLYRLLHGYVWACVHVSACIFAPQIECDYISERRLQQVYCLLFAFVCFSWQPFGSTGTVNNVKQTVRQENHWEGGQPQTVVWSVRCKNIKNNIWPSTDPCKIPLLQLCGEIVTLFFFMWPL